MPFTECAGSVPPYNPNKPDKYHLKLYAVSEVDSGYCLGFEVSMGQERKADPANKVVGWPSVVSLVQKCHSISDDSMLKFGACPVMDSTHLTPVSEIVMQLMHKYCLLDQGYHLYTDNFYSSPHLTTTLLKWDTGFCGTIWSNKKLWPVALLKACGGKKDDATGGAERERQREKKPKCGPGTQTQNTESALTGHCLAAQSKQRPPGHGNWGQESVPLGLHHPQCNQVDGQYPKQEKMGLAGGCSFGLQLWDEGS